MPVETSVAMPAEMAENSQIPATFPSDHGTQQGEKEKRKLDTASQRELQPRTLQDPRNACGTDDVPPAGLVSERCSRDFASRCYRMLHSGIKRQPSRAISTTYKDEQRKPVLRPPKNRDSATDTLCSHYPSSDKRRSLQKKLSQQFAQFNGGESMPPELHKESIVSDDPARGREEYRIRNNQHCCIFNDLEPENRHKPGPTAFSLEKPSDTPPEMISYNSVSGATDTNHPDSAGAQDPGTAEETIFGNNKPVSAQDPCWEVVSLRMSGVPPNLTEKTLENLARQCDVQVVSVHLDRNILTHCCNGNGKVKLRHTGGEEKILQFACLLAKSRIRLQVTDIISRSDAVQAGKH